jgi:hypothetical protein
MDNGTTTTKIGDTDIRLALPPSFAQRHEIIIAAGTNPQRAIFAALGVCWQGKDRPRAKYGFEPLVYGGAVLDELVGRGHKVAAMYDAGRAAFDLLSMSVLTESEVSAAEDFTEPPPAGSTG